MAFYPVPFEEIDVLVSFAIDEGLISGDQAQDAFDDLMRAQGLAAIELHGQLAGRLYPDLFAGRRFSRWVAGDLLMIITIADAYWYATMGCAPWAGEDARTIYTRIRARLKTLVKDRRAEFNQADFNRLTRRKWMMRMYTPYSWVVQSGEQIH